MSKKGKIVSEVPPVTRVRRSGIDWDGPALRARLSGSPVLAAEHVPDTTVKSVRQYRRAPFIDETGRIIVEMRNSRIEDDGRRYGDVYLRWENTQNNQEESK